jgi:alpha-acetolactate decarboxylase
MRTLLLLALVLLPACSTKPAIRQFGSMREVLREGESQPRVALSELAGPTTIAIGALAGLEGEITMLDGQTWVARPAGGALAVSGPEPVRGDHATLLTATEVRSWETAEFAGGPATGEDLESLIERSARVRGVDTARPFPFTITGVFDSLDIHVINRACIIANPDLPPERQPWRWSAAGMPARATIVGFYAPDAAGVMTHHGTAIHAHAIIEQEGGTITGHVERFAVPAGAVLGLPASLTAAGREAHPS